MEGDAKLLEQIRGVQETNLAQHERGRLRAHVTEEGASATDLEILYIWDRFGERRYWEFSGFTSGGRISYEQVEMIRRPDVLITHNAGAGFVRQTAQGNLIDGYQDVLKLHPTERWYVYDMGQRTLAWMLNPTAPGNEATYVVREGMNDEVVIERYRESRKAQTMTASLARGGNIIRVETDPEWAGTAGAYVRNAEYEWTSDGNGGWYPQGIRLVHSHANDPETAFWSLEVEIQEFDPAPRISANRFEFSSLSLAPDTRVTIFDEQGKKTRTWVVGRENRVEGPDQKRLDELAEELRASGFSAPERE